MKSAKIKIFTEINKPVWLAAESANFLSLYFTPPSMTVPNTSFSSISINLRPRRVSYHPSFRYIFFPVTSLCHILFSNCTLQFLLLTVEPYLRHFRRWDLSGPLFCVDSEFRKVHDLNFGTKVGYSDWCFLRFSLGLPVTEKLPQIQTTASFLFFTIHYLLILPTLDAAWSELWNISLRKPNKFESLP